MSTSQRKAGQSGSKSGAAGHAGAGVVQAGVGAAGHAGAGAVQAGVGATGHAGASGLGFPGAAAAAGSRQSHAAAMPKLPRTRRAALLVLVVLTACAGTAAGIRGGAAEWFAAAVLGAVLMVSMLPRIWMAGGSMHAQRLLTAGHGDGAVDVVLTVRSRAVMPLLLLQVREELINDSAASTPPLIHVCWTLPWLRREWSIAYKGGQLTRGSYRLSAVTITAVDPFGLCAARRTLACSSHFVVLPQAEGIPYAALRHAADSRPAGAGGLIPGAGRRELRMAGPGPGTRPYREGDPIRRLDWRAAAKGRELRVRTDEAGPGAISTVVLGAGAGISDSLLDRSAGLALQAVWEGLKRGEAVRLQAGGRSVLLGPDGGPGMETAASLLAELRSGSMGTLAAQLESLRERKQLSKGSSLILILPDWQNAAAWDAVQGMADRSGCRYEFRVPVQASSPSAAMREAMREARRRAEARGCQTRWIPLAAPSEKPYLDERREGSGYGQPATP